MAARRKSRGARLWMGAFSFINDDDTVGNFQLAGMACGPTAAANLFRDRLRSLKQTSTMFERTKKIFCDALFEMTEESFAIPALVNYTTWRDQPNTFELYCVVPEQDDARVRFYTRGSEREMNRPFMLFRPRKQPVPVPTEAEVQATLARLRAIRAPSTPDE